MQLSVRLFRLRLRSPRPQIKRNRPAQHSSGNAEERDVSGQVRGLQQQSIQPVDAMHDLGDPAPHRLHLFQPRVCRRGRLKLQLLAGLVPCPADLHQQRVPAAFEIPLHPRRLFRITFIAASLEAGRKAHLHLGVNAARKFRVRCKLLRAAPQQKKIQRVVGILLGLGPRGKWTEVRAARPQRTDARGDRNPRIRILAQQLHQWRGPQMQALSVLRRKLRPAAAGRAQIPPRSLRPPRNTPRHRPARASSTGVPLPQSAGAAIGGAGLRSCSHRVRAPASFARSTNTAGVAGSAAKNSSSCSAANSKRVNTALSLSRSQRAAANCFWSNAVVLCCHSAGGPHPPSFGECGNRRKPGSPSRPLSRFNFPRIFTEESLSMRRYTL